MKKKEVMTRQWGPTGVTDCIPVEINAEMRSQIHLELKSRKFEQKIPAAFFDALGAAISHFNSGLKLVEASKPSEVRNNLQKAIDSALVLNDRLNDLDGNSRSLVGDVGSEVSELQRIHLRKIIHVLDEASHLANEYPKRGRLPEDNRLWLAVNVADAINTHLGVVPTTTKNGVFESMLVIVLEMIAGNKEIKSVHDLTCRALKAKNLKSSPELTRYIPSEDV